MNRACIVLLVSTLVACSGDTPGGSGGGGGSAGSAGGEDAAAVGPGPMAVSSGATSTITSASASASSSTGGECSRHTEEGDIPATIGEAWLAHCEDLAAFEACVGCTPGDCVDYLDVILATEVPACADLQIAWYRCAAELSRITPPEDCWCDGGDGALACDLESPPCAAEKDAFYVCYDAAQP